MNQKDVLALLVYCNELDGRHAPNELKVTAWFDVFQESAPDLQLGFAQQTARKHYAGTDVMIAPNTFVREWKEHQRSFSVAQMTLHQRHCGLPTCLCTHDEPCFKGWIDREDGSATAPCRFCREELAGVLAVIPPPGMRRPSDWERLGR